MNQPPPGPWRPHQAPPPPYAAHGSQSAPYGYGPAPGPPPKKGVPVWAIVIVLLFGLPMLGVVGCIVCVGAINSGREHASSEEASTSAKPKSGDATICSKSVQDVAEMTKTGSSQRVDKIEAWLDQVRQGRASCDRAGMTKEADILRSAEEALTTAKLGAHAPRSSGALDPASCKRGRVALDTATGRTVKCTGSAEPVAAPSDDADFEERCRAARAIVKLAIDGVDPIVRCEPYRADHTGVKVLVTEAGWTYLGEHGRRREFVGALLEGYKPHWRDLHGWRGGDPSGHMIVVWQTISLGLDMKMVATIDASGVYAE